MNIKGTDIAVIGLSRSGDAAARLANHLGANVFVSDNSSSTALVENLLELKKIGINGEVGGHSESIYNSELWVLSPGIAQDSDLVKAAQSKNIPIVSEIEFASWFTAAPVIAVTGSNGKTTTVHALVEMCQSDKIHGVIAGNMGIPFTREVLSDLIAPDPRRVFVIEISSFQMEFVRRFNPLISVFLNISPDHLDRYKSMDEYVTAKLNMARNADKNNFIVFNIDDPVLNDRLKNNPALLVPFSTQEGAATTYYIENDQICTSEHATLVPLDAVALPGPHNSANLLAAATAAHLIGISNQTIATVMRNFQGVPHRLEKVALVNGVQYINDSKATNLDAVMVALQSFPGPIRLILGGKDKGSDFHDLIPFFENKVIQIIAIGQAKTQIFSALRDAVRPQRAESLRDAVKITWDSALPGDTVLLSPGCASFDQFRDFEDRGNQFKGMVRELQA